MKDDSNISKSMTTKHSDKIPMTAPVPMRHRNKLGATSAELMRDPYGNGTPSKAVKVGNGNGKTW